ncbi:MAG: TIR domain-containing protein [Anaerolineae bacterium]|nr:TIR domain-containing protein [Anaerolineae bacterium]
MSYVFISYSRKDSRYAKRLQDELLKRGFNVWIDRGIEGGADWWAAIVAALTNCGAFILLLTPDSGSSDWVRREILIAQQQNKPIFPLALNGGLNTLNGKLVIERQPISVQGRKLPNQAFFSTLARSVQPRPSGPGSVITAESLPALSTAEFEKLPSAIRNPPLLSADERLNRLGRLKSNPPVILAILATLAGIAILTFLGLILFTGDRSTAVPTVTIQPVIVSAPSATPTFTHTATNIPSPTATAPPSDTPAPTHTLNPSLTDSLTPSATPTWTPSFTPSPTASFTPTLTPSDTPLPTSTFTLTPLPTPQVRVAYEILLDVSKFMNRSMVSLRRAAVARNIIEQFLNTHSVDANEVWTGLRLVGGGAAGDCNQTSLAVEGTNITDEALLGAIPDTMRGSEAYLAGLDAALNDFTTGPASAANVKVLLVLYAGDESNCGGGSLILALKHKLRDLNDRGVSAAVCTFFFNEDASAAAEFADAISELNIDPRYKCVYGVTDPDPERTADIVEGVNGFVEAQVEAEREVQIATQEFERAATQTAEAALFPTAPPTRPPEDRPSPVPAVPTATFTPSLMPSATLTATRTSTVNPLLLSTTLTAAATITPTRTPTPRPTDTLTPSRTPTRTPTTLAPTISLTPSRTPPPTNTLTRTPTNTPIPPPTNTPVPPPTNTSIPQEVYNPPLAGYVNTGGSRANVRSGPGGEFSIITTLDNLTPVQVNRKYGDWYEIGAGWISVNLVTLGSPPVIPTQGGGSGSPTNTPVDGPPPQPSLSAGIASVGGVGSGAGGGCLAEINISMSNMSSTSGNICIYVADGYTDCNYGINGGGTYWVEFGGIGQSHRVVVNAGGLSADAGSATCQ